MNKNKRIRYSDSKPINDMLSNALIEGTDEWVAAEGCIMRTNKYRALVKRDPVEAARLQIAKNNRTMERLYKNIVKPEGFVEKAERLNKISLKSPEEANDHG